MEKNKQHVELNNKKYCNKCLSVLGEDIVRDNEENEFCSRECRRDFYYENKREMDSILSEFLK